MKTVIKIILGSCIFYYFAGLWTIASRFGLVKIFVRYGVSESFDKIPEDFPQIKYLYIGLIVYTVVFILVAYLICKSGNRTVKEQEQLQQQSAEVASYAELMASLLSRYGRSQNCEPKVRQKLQMLSRQIASLPPAVVRNANMAAKVRSIINNLQDLHDNNCSSEVFSSAIDTAKDDIDSLKRLSVTIKQ